MSEADHEYSICIIGDTVNTAEKSQIASEAKVCIGTLEYAKANQHKYYPFLSEKEQVRAGKYRFERDRYLYIAAHGSLREEISERINTPPCEIQFKTSLYGKPYIDDPTVSFNISHSWEYFAIIISDGTEVGIDIEGCRSVMDYQSIMKNFYSEKERSFVNSKSDSERMMAFYRIWTRKEALLKAIGIGLIDNLKELDTGGEVNVLDEGLIKNYLPSSAFSYYLYSKQLGESYVSFSGSKPMNTLLDYIS